jgi:hypothetical protein
MNEDKEKYDENFFKALDELVKAEFNSILFGNLLMEYYGPQLVKLTTNKEEENELDRKTSELIKSLRGVPNFLIRLKNEPKPIYDTYVNSAIDEFFLSYQKAKEAIRRAHIKFIINDGIEKHPEYIKKKPPTDLVEYLENLYWDMVEIAYIRLASYWDRAGQLLDYIFFNIRQYERDGFSAVIDRIHINVGRILPELLELEPWIDILKYRKAENPDGYKWLILRRNLIIHSISLKNYENYEDDDELFESNYNHLNVTVKRKLAPQKPKEELKQLHTQFSIATELFTKVLEISYWGAKKVNRVNK